MYISYIVVHYQVEKTIFSCIESIYQQDKGDNTIEIIVVDNGSHTTFKQRLLHKFKKVRYIKAPKNLGYGKGNNLGARKAKGDLLFFLNPDTILQKDCLKEITQFWEKNPHVGAVAPTLLHPDKETFVQQGSLLLTPIRALCAHSLLHRLWPNNPIAANFWLTNLNKNKNRIVEVCPGTAFTIPTNLFIETGLFDEKMFLYFEEYDFFLRLKKTNKKVWMLGKAQLIHQWGETTQGISTKKIYQESFRYYLKKHYGEIGEITYFLINNLKTVLGILALSFLGSLLFILMKTYGY
jgi:GT2 family glycosyltransferase